MRQAVAWAFFVVPDRPQPRAFPTKARSHRTIAAPGGWLGCGLFWIPQNQIAAPKFPTVEVGNFFGEPVIHTRTDAQLIHDVAFTKFCWR